MSIASSLGISVEFSDATSSSPREALIVWADSTPVLRELGGGEAVELTESSRYAPRTAEITMSGMKPITASLFCNRSPLRG
jgi:hypothetical protein